MTLPYLQVNGGSGSGYHAIGSTVAIGANIPQGYSFSHWSGPDVSTVANIYAPNTTVRVFGNLTITANFTSTLYTVNYRANSGGSITGDAVQNEYYGNYLTPVSASPDMGYHFTSWSDGSTSTSRRDVCRGNETYTASFELSVPVPPTEGNHGSGYVTII